MKYFSLLIVFLLNLQAVQAQNYENDSILIWNENRKLTWEDFQSKTIPKKPKNSATLSPSIKFYPNELFLENISKIRIIAITDKNESWVDDKSYEVLNHEQTHFNITELYARKIRKTLKDYFDKNNSYELDSIAEIYHSLEDNFWETQFEYDREIRKDWNNGKLYQKKWDKKIDSLLQVYKDYERNYTIEDLEEE